MKKSDTSFFDKKHWTYLILMLAPLLLYKKSLGYTFSPMDEQWMIEDKGWFLSQWSNLKAVFSSPTVLMIYYRPLLVLTTLIDFHIGKLDPFVYHFSNIIWHIGCIILLFEFLIQFHVNKKTALLMAMLFAVHPIMLHTVAWVPGRNDSMLCFFMLLSVIFLIKYIDQKKIKFFFLHLLFFVCSLFTKENAIVFPIIYLAIFYLRDFAFRRVVWTSSTVWVSIVLAWIVLQKSFNGILKIPDSNILLTVKNTAEAYLLYIGKTLFPFQQSVFPVLKHTSILPGLLTLCMFVILWWQFKPTSKKIALFGSFIFLILLLVPTVYCAMKSNGEHYEHRLYAPMIGVFLFLSQLKCNVKESTVTSVYVTIIITFSILTFKRMDTYKNQHTFLAAGIECYPEYYYFYLEKGQLLDKEGDFTNAIAAYDKALEQSPKNGQIFLDRGNAYFSLADKKNAIADYSMALKNSTAKLKSRVLMQRCIAYNMFNEPELAKIDLDTLKKCCQTMIEPEFEKDVSKKWEIEVWSKKVKAEPKNPDVHLMRGLFFIEQRMAKEAIADFKKASELAPGNPVYKEYYRRASMDLSSDSRVVR